MRVLSKIAALAVVPAALAARAETVRVADCVRDASLDYWAAADVRYCRAVMDEVFKATGVAGEAVPFSVDGTLAKTNADVICSAFRTPELEKDYLFPLQPICRMHFALYATPSRAMTMMNVKITEWPRLVVGYSPVSQGQTNDRKQFFEHAQLTPKYAEFKTSKGAVDALHRDEIDALFLYTPFGKRPNGVFEIVPIGDRNVYFAVRKDKPELFAALSKAYRDLYIDHIEIFDEWREQMLGIPKPQKRVRVAAYRRGDLFNVEEDGTRTGVLKNWLRTICGYTHWTVDYVYGGYDECLEAVKNGRLDIVGGIGFSPSRRKSFLFPHTPIGMLRVYLWAHPGSGYKSADPKTWRGMKVGLLSGTVSGERAKRQFDEEDSGITYKEFHTDREMLAAYFGGEVDACVDVEMPELANEIALHVYTAHPMYICTATGRQDLFDELEAAMEAICDDFPKYQRMISEHHYGRHSNMPSLSLEEAEWMAWRVKSGVPVKIDFSPWPFPIFDNQGKLSGFVAKIIDEFSRRTGLRFEVQPQTGIQTAEAKFLRGDTDFWVPYPVNPGSTAYSAVTVFSVPVPQDSAKVLGAEDPQLEFDMLANRGVSPQLVSILRKVGNDIGTEHLQSMFVSSMAERTVIHRVFGLTRDELVRRAAWGGILLLAGICAYGFVMMRLLRREAKRAKEAAALAESHAQAKTRFLAMMSHELRTPLNAVIGFAEFLSHEDLDEKRRNEYIEGILLSSNALLELINDVLDLTKLEAGAMEMRQGQCDIHRLLKELPAVFGYRVRKHGVVLKLDEPPEGSIPLLKLSQQGLRQILINLVGNSAKFTDHGSINVSAAWDGESRTLKLEVSDTGRGMSEHKMAHMFDPFVQDIASRMKAKSGDDPKGTGLGLPIVKRMIDAAGGEITVQSELGKGTRFTIILPGLEVVENLPSSIAAARTLRMAHPDRVLVVDDVMMNRKILGIHLANLKVKEVRYAENGVKALEVMKEWRPDVVLTDMWMPEMDGSTLAATMRRDRSLAEIPVVAITADVDVGSTYDLSLFASVMSKPVTGAKLKDLFGEL